LFYLLEFVLCSGPPGALVEVHLREEAGQARVVVDRLQTDPPEPDLPFEGSRDSELALNPRLALAIVRQIIESAGGSLQILREQVHLQAEIRLPLQAPEA